jgi:hypothetical protein
VNFRLGLKKFPRLSHTKAQVYGSAPVINENGDGEEGRVDVVKPPWIMCELWLQVLGMRHGRRHAPVLPTLDVPGSGPNHTPMSKGPTKRAPEMVAARKI